MSEGEADVEKLFDVAAATGTAAVNIIPDRNYRPGVKDEKLRKLYEIIEVAGKRGFPIIVGTEMNAPGNKFVDSFNTAELKPLVPVFLRGAHIIYGHTVLQRQRCLGYLSAWAREQFASVHEKNDFFETVGRELQPAKEDVLNDLAGNPSPSDILAKLR
jgi:hypothetical protein